MGKVVILDEITSNKIAAGEVVERPASVVKELVENSIDAGASSISVEIKNGGISYIKVTDNGCGIAEDDAEIAFERHATSKIRSADDLDSISTMGFRGEALASIASVASVELTTRVPENSHGTYILIQGGNTKEVKQVGCPIGTTFVVRNLFYNTPARFKFLKKDSTEAGYISDIICRIALAKPEISLRLISNNTTVIHSPGNNDLLSSIYSVYGKEAAKQVYKIDYTNAGVSITGYAGKPEIARANRNQQSIFINGRYVKSKIVSSALDEAYKTFLMKNKFAFAVINININPTLIDVNVHPTKMEVRFSEEQEIFRSVYHAVTNALFGNNQIKSVQLDDRDRSIFKFDKLEETKPSFTQQNIYSRNFKSTPKETKTDIAPTHNTVRYDNKADDNERIAERQIDIKPKAEKPLNLDVSSYKAEKLEDLATNKKEVCEKSLDTPKKCEKLEEKNDAEDNPIVKETDSNELNNQGDVQCMYEDSQKENILISSKLIGQAFSTYIILQHESEIILIDQHAAHERVLFEKLKKKYLNNDSLSQMLLTPVVIELTGREIKFLEEEHTFFSKLGFIYEEFGNNCIILRAVPYLMDGVAVKQAFMDIVDFVISSGFEDYKAIEDETLYTIACKSAVKAKEKLDELEIQSLLAELKEMKNPYTCPHGRPTILKITKYEIEKMFKRII